MTSRRTFVQHAGVLTAAATLTPALLRSQATLATHVAPAPLSLLILGGTGFIGPHLVRLAVAHGHRVSIFTRGRRDGELPAGVERLVGDRNGQLDALAGRTWDAVIDDSATNPQWVKLSTELLKSSGRYLFTSSTGVYYPYLSRGLTEADSVHTTLADAKDGSEVFGTNKAQCEALVQQVFGARGIVVRPTYIVGPGDYTDRFTHWPVRLAKGGDVLAPGHKSDGVQFIDVRDLAAFMLLLVETNGSGIYNAVGPRQAMTVEQFLAQSIAALKAKVQLTWVDDYDFLAKYEIDGVVPWILTRGNDLGHTSIVSTRSFTAGLAPRPMAETVRDTLAWFSAQPPERQASAKWVLTDAKEKEMLAAWRARTGGR
jgi:2'-hydroxyisoflavone reductase